MENQLMHTMMKPPKFNTETGNKALQIKKSLKGGLEKSTDLEILF